MAAIRKLTDNFIATRVDDELLIVDLDGGELFSLRDTARSVWNAIDGMRDEIAIAGKMSDEHEGDPARIAIEVATLLGELEDAALIARE